MSGWSTTPWDDENGQGEPAKPSHGPEAQQDRLTAVERAVDALTDTFETVMARLEAGGPGRSAEAPETADPADLDTWVKWLCETYGLRLRPDWSDTPGYRQELAALHAAHLAAFDEDHRPLIGFDALHWHDALTRVWERLDDWSRRFDQGRRRH